MRPHPVLLLSGEGTYLTTVYLNLLFPTLRKIHAWSI